jgi:hypothetical protein
MRKLIFAAPAAILLAAPLTYAAGYGAAGCGLGSMVFGSQPGLVQILAATTNGTFASQTFGITTGTSNCGAMGGGQASTKAFIDANREALAKDISRGQGETIANLSVLAGCSDASAVGAELQKNFQSIFPAASISNDQVGDAVISTLKSDAALSCHKLG